MSKYKISELERKTLTWWHNRKKNIDFNPPYQRRGGLWNDYDKGYLIDSIINGFDIPKIYLADFTWNDSPKLNKDKKMYAIIDGKQRLETIFDFFENNIALNDDFSFITDTNIKAAGMKYRDLENQYPDIAEIFREFNLAVVTVVTEDEEIINELFIRLNRNKTLTGAEIRNAMKGDIPRIIREISQHEFFQNYAAFDVQRGQDQNAAAKLLLFEYYEKVSDTKKKELDEFAAIQKYEKKKMELAVRNVIDNLKIMCNVFLPKDKLLKLPGLLPVYYWFLRNMEEKMLFDARAFLVWFDNKRRENTMEEDYVEFARYNRSTNDEVSFSKRCEILKRQYKNWIKNRK